MCASVAGEDRVVMRHSVCESWLPCSYSTSMPSGTARDRGDSSRLRSRLRTAAPPRAMFGGSQSYFGLTVRSFRKRDGRNRSWRGHGRGVEEDSHARAWRAPRAVAGTPRLVRATADGRLSESLWSALKPTTTIRIPSGAQRQARKGRRSSPTPRVPKSRVRSPTVGPRSNVSVTRPQRALSPDMERAQGS
jgi:hypothetical protein